jgi:hypothetical protein
MQSTIETRHLLAFLEGVETSCRRHNDEGGLRVVAVLKWFIEFEAKSDRPRGGPGCEPNPPQQQPGVTLTELAVMPANVEF